MVEFYPFLLDYFQYKKSFEVILTFKTKGLAHDEWSWQNTHHIGAIGFGLAQCGHGCFVLTGAGVSMHVCDQNNKIRSAQLAAAINQGNDE